MIYTLLLMVHIVGAIATALVALFAGVAIWRGAPALYRPAALVLGFLGGFEVLTGVVLAVVSTQVTALALCANITVYLTSVFAVEALLWMKMKKVSMLFPLVPVLSPVAASLMLFVTVAQFGF